MDNKNQNNNGENEWVQSKDPSGKLMWINKRTFATTYELPITSLDVAIQEIASLRDQVVALSKYEIYYMKIINNEINKMHTYKTNYFFKLHQIFS